MQHWLSYDDTNRNLDFYFVHSYHAHLKNFDEIKATIKYGSNNLAAVVKRNNIFGCQFHPEKSGSNGLKIIKNFLELN